MKTLVRPPGERFTAALTGQQPRPVIDFALARRQHDAYCAALRSAGAELVVLSPDEDHPDACFVQDTAVPFGELAIVAHFGVASRQGEQDAVRPILAASRRLVEIRPPGTLEGGDVLVVGRRLFVGLSQRTNRAGYAQMRDVLMLQGAAVEPLDVPAGLHLLSGCTYLGQGVLLAAGPYATYPEFAALDVIQVPPGESPAANALALGESVILPGGYPQTAALIRSHGFDVLPVDLSEFAKADGGATCLALLF